MYYFCPRTGIRLASPGVHKSIDPVNGVDEYIRPEMVEQNERPEQGAPAKRPRAGKKE